MESAQPSAPTQAQPQRRILIVDDQRNMRVTTALLLRSHGYQVAEAAGPQEALDSISKAPPDLMLTDLRMEPFDGLELLKRALEISPRLQVIVMTAFGSVETAVEAIRRGAFDYIAKPFREGELLHRVMKSLEHTELVQAVDLFSGEFNSRHGLTALIGQSGAIHELTSRILRVAPSDATVLVQGESGTGKELVARALHAHSRRREHPFVAVNCAAITDTLLESELFGHAKGAFSGATKSRAGFFEEAHGGTLFIDEVTETSPAFQTKLLRALQSGEVRRVGESTSIRVDVRIIAATNRDVEAEVKAGRFRQDLFYRLNVVGLWVPPLRERLEDLPLLADHFLQRINARAIRPKRLTAAAIAHLQSHSFPGNVRELENLIEQAAALAEGEELVPDDFPIPPPGATRSGAPGAASGMPTLADAVAEAERKAIAAAVERTSDLGQAAAELGISSTTLWRKMKRLGLTRE
jgi:two-component system, NtrC family, response regulator HydG